LEWNAHKFSSVTEADLTRRYEQDQGEYRLFVRRYDTELLGVLGLAIQTGNASLLDTVERGARAALGQYSAMTADQLVERITGQGTVDGENLKLRYACYHFAVLYAAKRNPADADRAAALLARFAEVVPNWPIWSPYWKPYNERTPVAQSAPESTSDEYAAGLWGDWFYYDLIMATPLLMARSMIADSGALAARGAEESVRSLLKLHLNRQEKYTPVPDYSNMDAFVVRGRLDFGLLMPDPEILHQGVDHLRALFQVGFYPDGWWHEASSAYHTDLVSGLRLICSDYPQPISDPPGFVPAKGTRFDSLILADEFRGPLGRAEAVSRSVVLPDRNMMTIHDTPWPFAAPSDAPALASGVLHGAMGQASLVSDGGADRTIATLHWGRAGTHSHADALRFHLWTKGSEVVSGNQYHPLPESTSSRALH